ncbi:MAG: DUF1810 domain-containing protein [Planctomycetaceae bacterium]|nr:MAG: DUF1810 domain-containing protein [Planctomycetaceae bacterium]
MNDEYNLNRFVVAQAPVFGQVVNELKSGRKRGHWMWFIFPQVKGLGSSQTAQEFAIGSLQEAEAYLRHSLLGPRLRECAGIVATSAAASAEQIFGYPDVLKLRSSMTLFREATADNEVFSSVLARYFGGEADPKTTAILGSPASHSR